MAVFDSTASANDLGPTLVLNGAREVIADSTSVIPHALNLADRDYFRIHQNQPDVGLFFCRLFRSRLRGGDASIAISRRVSAPDGRFDGVVVAAVRLAYFQNLFKKLNFGSEGSVTLMRLDGRLIARYQFSEADFDRDMSGSPNFGTLAAGLSGSFEATSAYGVKRLYTFRHIGNLPLVLSVAVSLNEIQVGWWRKALISGSIMVVLCSATVALCLLFRREILRRMVAENALIEAADELSVMAASDGLTGLANRRAFDTRLEVEWKRALRSETTLGVLMFDVDYFKLYNVSYGHREGDHVLQIIAICIREHICRPGDLAARYRGEEFVAVLPEAD